jgi:hypothetical protein
MVSREHGSIFGVYSGEIEKFSLLTREREIELAKRIQLGKRKMRDLLQKAQSLWRIWKGAQNGRRTAAWPTGSVDLNRSTSATCFESLRRSVGDQNLQAIGSEIY